MANVPDLGTPWFLLLSFQSGVGSGYAGANCQYEITNWHLVRNGFNRNELRLYNESKKEENESKAAILTNTASCPYSSLVKTSSKLLLLATFQFRFLSTQHSKFSSDVIIHR